MSRFAVDSEHDHSATAWIASLLSLFYSVLSLGARYYLKSGTIALDDGAIVIAQVIAFGQFGSTFYGISQGLGKDLALLSSREQIHSANAFEASQILYVLALAVSKMSVVILIDRIFAGMEYRHASTLTKALMGIVAVWGIGSGIAVSAACDAAQILPGHGAALCAGSTARWLVVTILDCVTELCLVVVPSYFLTDLQMNISHKTTAGMAFAFRLGVIPFSALHYTTYSTALSNDSAGTSISTVLSWQQATLCYSLLSATVPLSRTFFKRFETGNVVLNQTGTYGKDRTWNSSVRGDTLKSDISKSRSKSGSVGGTTAGERFWWNPRSTYSTAVYHEEASRHVRAGSQDMIIWREDQIEVQRSSIG